MPLFPFNACVIGKMRVIGNKKAWRISPWQKIVLFECGDTIIESPYESVLRAIGKNLLCLGENGRGNILKLLNNYVALTNQAALCEAMALADRLDIDRQTVGEVLTRASGANFILERKLSALVVHDYRAGFFIDLAWKDLPLALDLAERARARHQVASQACELYGEASQAGFGRHDSSGLLHLLEPRPA